MLASRLGIRSLGASGSAGVALPAAGAAWVRVRRAESLGLLCAWLCLGAAGCVSAGAGGAHSRGGGQPGLSEPLGLGWLRPDLGVVAVRTRRAVGPRRSREVRPRPRRLRRGAEHGTA